MIRKCVLRVFMTICLISLILSCVFGCNNDSSHSHAYKQQTYSATCITAGVNIFTCECGDIFTVEIPALGHTEVIDAGVVPTCTESGLSNGKHCSVCNEVLEEQQTIPETGHSYETIVTAPTPTEYGFTTYICQCGDSYIDDYKEPTVNFIDYVENLTFNENSGRVYQQVTVKSYIDGDTTHFNLTTPIHDKSVLKARYIAIDTPESTGKIEPYGKKAASFTKEALENATSIIVESDTSTWNYDSTGERMLVWVWYKTAENAEYRNLNLEILQNGLAVASKTANNSYGTVAMAALNQAKALKYNVHSGQKDPDMYYGAAIPLTLKELRTNIAFYNGKKVAFEAVVVKNDEQAVYVEEYDEENDMYNGMYVYYGFGASGYLLRNIEIGNRVRIVGTVSYWEAGDSYQVSGLSYDPMRPQHENNTYRIGTDTYTPAYNLVTADKFVNGTTSAIVYDEESGEEITKQFKYAELALGSTIEMRDLYVKRTYTSTNEETSWVGAFTLTCECNGVIVEVRTTVLYDENKQLVKASDYLNKTITVRGVVDIYSGDYQIKVLDVQDLIIQ